MKALVSILVGIVSAMLFSICPLLATKLWHWVANLPMTHAAWDFSLITGILGGIFGGIIVALQLLEEME